MTTIPEGIPALYSRTEYLTNHALSSGIGLNMGIAPWKLILLVDFKFW